MTILVAIDETQQPLEGIALGSDLAHATDVELVVLHVTPQKVFDRKHEAQLETNRAYVPVPQLVYPSVGGNRRELSSQRQGYFLDDAEEDAAAFAEEAVDRMLDTTGRVAVKGRVGDPVEEILGEVERLEPEYLYIGGRKRTPVGKAVFGSITQSLLLQSDVPVVTVPKTSSATNKAIGGPIVAAVDRSTRAQGVVEEAWAVSSALGRELHVVHVLTEREFVELGRTSVEQTGPGITMDEIRSLAASIAHEVAEPIADQFQSIGLVGEPSSRINDYAEQNDAGYIVTSGRKRSPVGKVLFGSVTQSILLNSDRPVISAMTEA